MAQDQHSSEKDRMLDDLRLQYGLERGDANVMARWLIYGFAPNSDTDAQIAGIVDFQQNDVLVDVGASNGSFIRLIHELHPTMHCIGIEPFTSQYRPQEVQRLTQALESELRKHGLQLPEQTSKLEIIQGTTETLQTFPESSIDIITALYMLYHVPKNMRQIFYEDVIRTLRSSGVFCVSTSGDKNKSAHREVEESVAGELGIKPPPHMNSGFTTEIAMLELLYFLDYGYKVFHKTISSEIPYNIDTGINTLLGRVTIESQLSLADQYSPPQDSSDDKFAQSVVNELARRIAKGNYVEHIERANFVIFKPEAAQSRTHLVTQLETQGYQPL